MSAPRPKCARQRRAASLRRKLEREIGPLRVEEMRGAAAMGELLSLEDTGWKGRAGSSMIRCRRRARFVREAIAGAEMRDALRIARLTAGGRTLAMTSWFRIGDQAFGFKAAYCEHHRRYAPGLLLLDWLTTKASSDGLRRFDSCSEPGSQPISGLWPGRRELLDVTVALGGPARQALHAGVGQAQDAWHALRRIAARG